MKVKELRSFLQNSHLDDATLVPTVVICLGLFVFIVSFLGATGACQDSTILIDTYSICMLSLVLLQLALASLIFLFLDDIGIDSIRNFTLMWTSRLRIDNVMMIEMIQENLECCGLNSASDYLFPSVPLSCCAKNTVICTPANAFKVGCSSQLKESIHSAGHMIGVLCIVAAGFEVECLCTAMFILEFQYRLVSIIIA